jgi:hypothetical protein
LLPAAHSTIQARQQQNHRLQPYTML